MSSIDFPEKTFSPAHFPKKPLCYAPGLQEYCDAVHTNQFLPSSLGQASHINCPELQAFLDEVREKVRLKILELFHSHAHENIDSVISSCFDFFSFYILRSLCTTKFNTASVGFSLSCAPYYAPPERLFDLDYPSDHQYPIQPAFPSALACELSTSILFRPDDRLIGARYNFSWEAIEFPHRLSLR